MNSIGPSQWGAIVTSVISMLVFSGCLVASFFIRDPGLLNLVVGAAVANATTVINFWLGSSSGGRAAHDRLAEIAKDDRRAATAVVVSKDDEIASATVSAGNAAAAVDLPPSDPASASAPRVTPP